MFARAPRAESFTQDEGGATIVEFALLIPLFCALVLGGFEVGWALHCGSKVRWALERSSRQLFLRPGATAAELQDSMVEELDGLVTAEQLELTLTKDPESQISARVATTGVSYAHDVVAPFLPTLTLQFRLGTTVPLS